MPCERGLSRVYFGTFESIGGFMTMKLWNKFGLEDAAGSEKWLFFITIGFVLGLVVVGTVVPELFTRSLNTLFDWTINYFGWWFLALGVVLLIFSIFIAFSRYGHVRIGGQDAEPEFDVFSWLSMVFTVGFGSSIITWGVGEPVAIAANPPPQPFPVAASSKSLALAFMYLHGTFPAMAMWYLPLTAAFGLMVYSGRKGNYKISSMLEPVLDKDRYGWVYWLVNLAALVAIIGGLATSLGFTAQQLSTILSGVFGLHSIAITYALFAVIGLILLADVWLGLERGIRNAARGTVILMSITFLVLLFVGPTLYILNIGLDATGVWLNNLPRMMLYTAPTSNGNWPQQWTSFWWAWWAAWGIFVGSFVARVSKGRTIRETFSILVIVPTALAWIQHVIAGGWALAPGYFGPVSTTLSQQDIPSAVAKLITLTPLGSLIGALLVAVMAGFLLTTLDSAVFMLSAITLGSENPNSRNRIWWAVILTFLGVMTLNLPSFQTMQQFAPIMGLPFSVFFIVIAYASYITARDYYRDVVASQQNGSIVSLTQKDSSTSENVTQGDD